MLRVMEGVRILEVAQFTFVPAAGAVLADWGADVIKVEHPVTGDAQRGLLQVGGRDNQGNINFLMEHANRGKRSIGLDLKSAEGREVLNALIRSADVFLTNFLPGARSKMNRFRRGDFRFSWARRAPSARRAGTTRPPTGREAAAAWDRRVPGIRRPSSPGPPTAIRLAG